MNLIAKALHMVGVTFATVLLCSSTAAAPSGPSEHPADRPTKIELVANAAGFADTPAELLSLLQHPQLFGLSPTQTFPVPRIGDLIGAELHGAALLADSMGLKDSPEGSPIKQSDAGGASSAVAKVSGRQQNAIPSNVDEKGPYQLNVPRVGLFEAVPIKIERAVGEEPLWRNKGLEVKEGIQSVVAGVVQPKPLLDTIQESEKYGNTGEKLKGVSNAVVRGYEGFSRIYNSILEVPKNFFQNLASVLTDKLNNLGAKIDGL